MLTNSANRKVVLPRRFVEEKVIEESPKTVDLSAIAKNYRVYRHFFLKLSRPRLVKLREILIEQGQRMTQQLEDHDSEVNVRTEEWRAGCVKCRALKRQQITEIDAILRIGKRETALETELKTAIEQRDSARRKFDQLRQHLEEQEEDTYLRHFQSIARTVLTGAKYELIKSQAMQYRDKDLGRVAVKSIDCEMTE